MANIGAPMPTDSTQQPPVEGQTQDAFEEEGRNVIIIHPGSQNLLMGRANDGIPVSVAHVVARRVKPGVAVVDEPVAPLDPLDDVLRHENWFPVDCLTRYKKDIQSYSAQIPLHQVASYNSQSKPQKISEMNDKEAEWTDVDALPEVVVGQAAMAIPDDAPYQLFRPIVRGRLNTSSSRSLTAVMSDLTVIWSHVLSTHFGITRANAAEYRAVVVVADTSTRAHVTHMLTLALTHIGFAAASIIQASVCATFGAGLPTGCVIDIGDQTTSIACVDDGVIVPDTRLTLRFGGYDITRALHWLLKKVEFPYHEFDIANRLDLAGITALRARICHLNLDVHGTHIHELYVRRKGKPTLLHRFKLADQAMQAAMGLFQPGFFGMEGSAYITTGPDATPDHDDHLNDTGLEFMDGSALAFDWSPQELMKVLSRFREAEAAAAAALAAQQAQQELERKEQMEREQHQQQQQEQEQEQSQMDTPLNESDLIGLTRQSSIVAHDDDGGRHTPMAMKDGVSGRQTPAPAPAPAVAQQASAAKPQPVEKASVATAAKRRKIDKTAAALLVNDNGVTLAKQSTATLSLAAQDEPLQLMGLDEAILWSISQCKGDELRRSMYRNLILAGGCASMRGLMRTLQERLVICANLMFKPVPEGINFIYQPKDITPRHLSWKGAAVAARLESFQDAFVTQQEWRQVGVRAAREKIAFVW